MKKIRKKLNKLCSLVKKRSIDKTMFEDISSDSDSEEKNEKDLDYLNSQPFKIKYLLLLFFINFKIWWKKLEINILKWKFLGNFRNFQWWFFMEWSKLLI